MPNLESVRAINTDLDPTRRTALRWAASMLAVPSFAWAAAPQKRSTTIWPVASTVPGGIARLPLGPSLTRPVARTGEVPVLVLGDEAEWVALVGIALSATLGAAAISVTQDGAGTRQVGYTVAAKKYAEQHLKVAPGTVDLSPENEARYQRERAHQATVVATFSEPAPLIDTRADALRMQLPVTGRRSSSFGLRRVFNGKPRNPHSGMDIAAATGTPINAPLAGRVIVLARGRC